jgi:hypothetical protein
MLVTTESVFGLPTISPKIKILISQTTYLKEKNAMIPLTHCLNAAREVLKRGMMV